MCFFRREGDLAKCGFNFFFFPSQTLLFILTNITHFFLLIVIQNIGSVLYFLLAVIAFFLLVLTSKWPSIIGNNNIMPQIVFKNKLFVKLNLLQLNCVDLF
jgi:hypothetical protein